MKERPILFSAPMVRAILEGRKTQTRRVVKPQPHGDPRPLDGEACAWPFSMPAGTPEDRKRCPYGAVGGRLWVRETFAYWSPSIFWYAADAAMSDGIARQHYTPGRCRPSIHMPRWASRITLEVTGVRVEQLQEISEADAKAEGAQWLTPEQDEPIESGGTPYLGSFRDGFEQLWRSINGAESWAANPWVWVIEFKRVTP